MPKTAFTTRRSTATRRSPAALREQRDLRRAVGLEIRRAREDAGVSQDRLAAEAAIARALGGRLRIRIEPGSGPAIRDHIQAAMLQALLPLIDVRWARFLEVPVHRPVRGMIDLVLADQPANLLVATELQSQIRRLEQQLRWAMEKAEALRNLPDLAPQGAGDPPTISRLLVLRSTAATRALERTYGHVLAAAYPAPAHEVMAALTGTAPWPGAGILWMTVEGGGAHLIERRPRRPVR